MKKLTQLIKYLTILIISISLIACGGGKGNRLVVKCNEKKLAWDWIKQAGGLGKVCGASVISDAFGNIYITGSFLDVATFGNKSISSNGGYDIFIAKYNASGELKWVQRAGGLSDDDGTDIGVDGSGNLYITGRMGTDGQGTTDGRNGCCIGNTNIFIMKFDSLGVVQWTQLASGSHNNVGENICVDISGNIFLSGYFNGDVTFGNKTLNSPTTEGVFFIAKYNSKGELDWVQKGDSRGIGLKHTIDNDDNIFLVYNTSCEYHYFIEKYTSKGEFKWKKEITWKSVNSSISCAAVSGINVDENSNVYMTGRFNGTLKFDSLSLQSVGKKRDINGGEEFTDNIFICKYSTDGNFIWAKQRQVNNSVQELGNSFTDAIGNTYITSTLRQSTFDEARSFESIKSTDHIYIVKYNKSGDLQWEMEAESSGSAYVHKITMDPFCNAYIIGEFIGNCTINHNTITSSNSYALLLVKLNGVSND